jgi:two-component system, OmpR family, sensor kinase
MTINTVRARLALWYVAALSGVLILFSAGVYVLFSRTLQNRLDGELLSAAQVTQLALNHEIEEHGGRDAGEASLRDVLRTMHQISFPRTAIAVWDGSRLVADKSGLHGLNTLAMKPQPGSRRSVRTVQVSGIRYRVLVTDARVPIINANYQVTVNEWLGDAEAELANLRYVLLLSVPLFVILSAAGGHFLARKSLRPVSDMARTMERITSANLDQRLTIPNRADEFGRLGETFNRLLDRLGQAFAHRQRFMADASHELRTPLSVALTATQFTLQKPDRDSTELREALTVVEEQLRRLKRIVEDMFVLAQADAGAYKPSFSPVYLSDVADEVLRAARVLAHAKGIEIVDSRPGDDFDFEGDEGLLRQLILILLDNAVKYTDSGGLVELKLATEQDGYALQVRDTGVGIPEADQPLIFERFYRSDKARSRRDSGAGSGAGLGLAIAKWITEVHGGAISVFSSSSGSNFRVWLPYRRPNQLAGAD